MQKIRKILDKVVIRFAGDSGDGIQVTGQQMTAASALLGNDVHTFPDFPAEIRAPAGSVAGVSGFQLCFSSEQVYTPGDKLDLLFAFNPAAYKSAIEDLLPGGILIVDSDKFTEKDLHKAGLSENPLNKSTNEIINKFKLIQIPISKLTLAAVSEVNDLALSKARKCKNMFALGVVCWIYQRKLDLIINWIENKFKKTQNIILANKAALQAGFNYALTTEILPEYYNVPAAKLAVGRYRQLTGNLGIVLGSIAVAQKCQRQLFVAGYPITPASDILKELSKYAQKKYSQMCVTTFQAEDEMAAISACLGAAYGGSLALTCTSGPGFDLKMEAIGLAIMAELPLVVVDVQRAGPSTGMPTKSEQSDLLMAIFGRHGEAPAVVLAPKDPGDCFNIMFEAFQIAIHFMLPVIILSDASLANSSEAWKIPDIKQLLNINNNYKNYTKNKARSWVTPGTPGLEYRIGGLEKNPENHQAMVKLRAKKIINIKKYISDLKFSGLELTGEPHGEILLVTWGSTFGVAKAVVNNLQNSKTDYKLSWLHLRYLNPLPDGLGEILKNFKLVLAPENNLGQLGFLLRANYLVDVKSISKIQGKPFLISELQDKILENINAEASASFS